jgi:hypothetical protein
MTNDLPPELESFVAELRQVRAPRPSFKEDILTRARELGVPRRSWVPSWRLLGTGLAAALAAVVLFQSFGNRGDARPVPFVLTAANAVRISIVGDFNDWDPAATPLQRVDGQGWWVVVNLRPGRYRYSFVVDGTRWIADPSAPRAADNDFGTENSVVTIPGGRR